MSQLSKVRHSRHQWKHKATQRADHNRYWRTQLARVTQQRDRTTTALKETQARLRQLEAQSQGLAVQHKVDLVFLALQLFLVARIGFRAVSRVLSLLAVALGIEKAPCPQTIINWVARLSIVRRQSARLLKGSALSQAPFSNGLIWMIDGSIALGSGKIVAVLALDAQHHHLHQAAPSRGQVRCLAVSVAASWTGESIAALLQRLIATVGRPAAYLKDAGSELHKALDVLDAQGLASPSIDDISHAVANMLKRRYHDHPTFSTFVSACGRVSGKRKHTLLACLAPPSVHTKARFMHVHRLVTWADRVLHLSPAGGARAGSTLAKLRACLDALPACKALIKRFRDDAMPLVACQKLLKTQGLSHDTLAQCGPLIDAIPSQAVRRELTGSLQYQLQTAIALGLDQVGLPISSDAIASLFGVAKHPGVGETQDAARIALRLPVLCGLPTREEAAQVLDVSVVRQQEVTGQGISLTQQRREVLGHPERLESLRITQGPPHVELIARPKNQSNHQNIVQISTSYGELYGPQLRNSTGHRLLENAASPDRRETALTS
ncbi:MAG TPA: hypothetical protein VLQ80_12860 [Candidatus Saccharimonadia bacterium]|nr:hypothetical protein [Candidatus Saccharimonadia bacterium]